jgi:lysophospholipase L1-like esterase
MIRRRYSVTPWFLALVLCVATTTMLSAKTKKEAAPPDPKASVTPVPRTDHGWMQRHESMNANVSKGDAQLLMIGDSITHAWETTGKSVWKKYYGNRHAVNLGIGGDRTQHVLWRLDHGNIDGIHPKLAVVMIGTNNAGGGDTSDQIADGVKAVVKKLRTKLPDTKILLLAIFPRGKDSNDRLRRVNAEANEWIWQNDDGEHVFYLDIGPKFLTADGVLTKEIMPDALHPNAKGYEIWASAMEPMVAKLMGESK